MLVAQLMKTGKSGELLALARLSEVQVFEVEPIGKFTFRMTDAEKEQARAGQTEQVMRLIETVARDQPELMVFDELALAVARGLVAEDDAWRLIGASNT